MQMEDWGQEIQTDDRDQVIQIANQGEGWGWGLIMRAECPVLNVLQISHFQKNFFPKPLWMAPPDI